MAPMIDETTNGHVVHASAKETPQLYRDVDEKELQKNADACLANVSFRVFLLVLL
jgi:hypothetical protein